jgi:hypothetical protein
VVESRLMPTGLDQGWHKTRNFAAYIRARGWRQPIVMRVAREHLAFALIGEAAPHWSAAKPANDNQNKEA